MLVPRLRCIAPIANLRQAASRTIDRTALQNGSPSPALFAAERQGTLTISLGTAKNASPSRTLRSQVATSGKISQRWSYMSGSVTTKI